MEKIKRLRRRRPRDGAFCCKFARRQGVCCDCTVLCDKLEKGFHLCRKNDRMCMSSSLSCGRVLYCFCSRRAAVYTLDAALASAYKYRNTQGCSRRCPLPPLPPTVYRARPAHVPIKLYTHTGSGGRGTPFVWQPCDPRHLPDREGFFI